MGLNKILPILEKSAPLIATAIGGPGAGIAAKIIAEIFGGDHSDPVSLAQKVVDTDDHHEKLQEAEEAYKLEMAKIQESQQQADLQKETLEFQDIEEARSMQSPIFRYVVFGFIIILLVTDLAAIYLVHDKDLKGMLGSLFALLSYGLVKTFNFYFGK